MNKKTQNKTMGSDFSVKKYLYIRSNSLVMLTFFFTLTRGLRLHAHNYSTHLREVREVFPEPPGYFFKHVNVNKVP